MTETFDEAVERLRRETRLNEEIEKLARYLVVARNSPGLGYRFTGPQLAVLVDQLRELRGRRVAAGREPDDEVNAPADMCCCNVCLQGAPVPWFRDGCPLHPAPHLQADSPFDAGAILAARPPGWRPDPRFVPRPEPKTAQPVMILSPGDDYEVVDSNTGRQLATFCSADSCQAARYGGSDLCGGCGACTRAQAEHSGHIVRRLQPDDDDDDIDWDAGPPVRPEPYPPPFKRRPPTVRELNEADGLDPMVLDLPLLPDGPGEHGEPAWARGAAMPGDRIGPRLKCGLWLSSDCPVADTRGYVDCLLWHVDCLACEPLSEAP